MEVEALDTIVGSLLEEPTLVDDPEWDTFAVIASIAPEVAEMTAYRYRADEAPKPTPLLNTPFTLFRQLQADTATPDGELWRICIVKIDRDSRRGAVNFVYGEDAELWRVTPDTAGRVAENARPQPVDFL
jgi:hypothetical protein